MGEFAVTAAGHSFVEHIKQPRIHSSPVGTFNRAVTTPYLYQINRAQIIRNTIERLEYLTSAVQMLKQRGSAKSADMDVALK